MQKKRHSASLWSDISADAKIYERFFWVHLTLSGFSFVYFFYNFNLCVFCICIHSFLFSLYFFFFWLILCTLSFIYLFVIKYIFLCFVVQNVWAQQHVQHAVSIVKCAFFSLDSVPIIWCGYTFRTKRPTRPIVTIARDAMDFVPNVSLASAPIK